MELLAICSNMAMEIEDVWDAHLRAIVDELAPGEGRGVKRPAFREIAAATRSSEEYIYQIYTGIRRCGLELAKSIGKAYAGGRDPSWIHSLELGGKAQSQEFLTSLTSGLSGKTMKNSSTKRWGELMGLEELDESFEVELEDNAMSPEFPAGMIVRFRRVDSAKYGNRVILRDRAGRLHFREFAQSFDEDDWVGRATGRGFSDIRPGRDGAFVVAVKTGHVVSGA